MQVGDPQEGELLELLDGLLRVPSPAGHELPLARWVARWLGSRPEVASALDEFSPGRANVLCWPAGAPTLAVEYGAEAGLASLADEAWRLEGEIDEYVAPVLLTLPFQLLGYFMGVVRGRNPDTLATDNEANVRAWLTSFPLGTH